MKTELEKIQEEITQKVSAVRAEETQAAQREQETRRAYDAARERMAAALDSGNLEEYKAAGVAAEEKRLELEFIEKSRDRSRAAAASVEDENRIRHSLVAESGRIRADALAQLMSIYKEAADVAANALQQFVALDGQFSTWERVVMRKQGVFTVAPDAARLTLLQMANMAKAQIDKIKIMEGR